LSSSKGSCKKLELSWWWLSEELIPWSCFFLQWNGWVLCS
jgi:hypothetical protein